MTESFGKILNEYYNVFKKDFPYGFQVRSEEVAERDAAECIKKNVPAEKLFPEKYGACEGKLF